jgi:hypothetical protein
MGVCFPWVILAGKYGFVQCNDFGSLAAIITLSRSFKNLIERVVVMSDNKPNWIDMLIDFTHQADFTARVFRRYNADQMNFARIMQIYADPSKIPQLYNLYTNLTQAVNTFNDIHLFVEDEYDVVKKVMPKLCLLSRQLGVPGLPMPDELFSFMLDPVNAKIFGMALASLVDKTQAGLETGYDKQFKNWWIGATSNPHDDFQVVFGGFLLHGYEQLTMLYLTYNHVVRPMMPYWPRTQQPVKDMIIDALQESLLWLHFHPDRYPQIDLVGVFQKLGWIKPHHLEDFPALLKEHNL